MNIRSHDGDASHVSPDESACAAAIVDAAAVAAAVRASSPDAVMRRATAAFAALGDPTRFRILEALCAVDELCVCDIAEAAAVSQSAASHQLRVLRDRDLVTFRRDGQRALYRVSDEHVAQMLLLGIEHAGEVRP